MCIRDRNTTVHAGLYARLSVEDETNSESTSIQTHKAMLTDYCHERSVDEDGCPMQVIEIFYRFIGKTEIDLYDLLCPAA